MQTALPLREKLDLVKAKAEREKDDLLANWVEVKREILDLCDESKTQDDGLSSDQLCRLSELETRARSIERAIQFCHEFTEDADTARIDRRQQQAAFRRQANARKEREARERQSRLVHFGEITVRDQQKAIKVANISAKTLAWLKSVMNDGISTWEDRFVFEICDRSWVCRAASARNVETCLELFWHLMLVDEFFPTKDRLIALSERTGTPSMDEFTAILGNSTMCAWVQMTREYVTTRKEVTELEFAAQLGDIIAQKN